MESASSIEQLPVAVAEFCEMLGAKLKESLGELLVAIYVFGSAAVGDFQPGASDLDLLVVVSTGMTDPVKSRLVRLLWGLASSVPTRCLELWVYTSASLRSPEVMGDYELMVTTDVDDPMTLDGADHRGEAPLIDLDLTRASGVAVLGPDPSELIMLVPRERILASIVERLENGLEDGPESYAVLNAARSLAFVRTGRRLSKHAGGAWAVAEGGSPSVVEWAMRAHVGEVPDREVSKSGRRYVESVLAEIRAQS